LGEVGKVVLQDAAIEPEQVADGLLQGMAADRFLILPHPDCAARALSWRARVS
jgi:hypothetical protein